MTKDYLRLADEALEKAQGHRDAIRYVASNNDASLELTEAEFLESLASAIREQAGEIERLKGYERSVDAYMEAKDKLQERVHLLEEENELLAGDSVGIEKRLEAEVARLKSELEKKDEALKEAEQKLSSVYKIGAPSQSMSVLSVVEKIRAALAPTPEEGKEEQCLSDQES